MKLAQTGKGSIPIWFVSSENWNSLLRGFTPEARHFAKANGFEPHAGRVLILPDAVKGLGGVLLGQGDGKKKPADAFMAGKLVGLLPKGLYHFANAPVGYAPTGDARALELATLAWLLSSYKFSRYKASKSEFPQLVAPKGVDAAHVESLAKSVALVRDLVNTPANDLGPEDLERSALALCKSFKIKPRVLRGAQLLKQNFPLIHAVGRAAKQEPRLIDFSFGPLRAPKVTLVGKGVCFDTGGLDLKPSSAMLMMKKDMAGAATALGLARMIMQAKLPIRLRVLLPIVENSVSSDSFRPGDIYPSRKGLSVEIGNTDAEGRLILADALALADEEAPDLLVDFATLTGAARVALGPDLPAFYATEDGFAAAMMQHGLDVQDPVWRMPLWDGYDPMIDGKISDLNNVGQGPFAGSIVAALFLRRFVSRAKCWAHFDLYAWNPSTKPGRPEGGEAQVARALFDLLSARYGRGSKQRG